MSLSLFVVYVTVTVAYFLGETDLLQGCNRASMKLSRETFETVKVTDVTLLGRPSACSPGKFWKSELSEMPFSAFWNQFYATIYRIFTSQF